MLSSFLSNILLAPPTVGDAYLDPGSGSYILQILIAALLGSLFFFRSFFGKIIKFFRKGSEDVQATDEQSAKVESTQRDSPQE